MSSNIQATMMTPGWAEIVKKAQNRIQAAQLAAVSTRDEDEALKLHRAAWAAFDALQEFIEELES